MEKRTDKVVYLFPSHTSQEEKLHDIIKPDFQIGLFAIRSENSFVYLTVLGSANNLDTQRCARALTRLSRDLEIKGVPHETMEMEIPITRERVFDTIKFSESVMSAEKVRQYFFN